MTKDDVEASGTKLAARNLASLGDVKREKRSHWSWDEAADRRNRAEQRKARAAVAGKAKGPTRAEILARL